MKDFRPQIKNQIRSLSGVSPVALLTKPYPCPGKCIYCPEEKGIPKSYLSKEPAVMRAIANKFGPVSQITQRLKMYQMAGHSTSKIEIIIIGATWSYYPKSYQEDFIKKIYLALNSYNGNSSDRVGPCQLNKAKRDNEKAKCRCVGMSIETRPDFINRTEIRRLREYGVTRVELGVQTLEEKVLRLVKRGHGVKEIIIATKLLKDAGFKVCYHLMPNLPGATPNTDYQTFKEVFSNSDFRPDQLKIYPCVLAGKSELSEWYKKGKWKPYEEKDLIDLLTKIKSEIIPRYVRIMRLWRDIPASEIEAGSEKSHMREIIQKNLKTKGQKCLCIRCREIMNKKKEKNLHLLRTDYQASGAKEIFLEYVDSQDNIYGLLRLRIPQFSATPPILKDSAIVRELHVFGQSEKIGAVGKIQHHGLGKKLLSKAEEITQKEYHLPKIAIISGVGVRPYYRRLGYHLVDEYMIKDL